MCSFPVFRLNGLSVADYRSLLFILLIFVLPSRYLYADMSLSLSPMPGLPSVDVMLATEQRAELKQRAVLRLGVAAGQYEPLVVLRKDSVKGIAADYLSIIGSSLDVDIEVNRYSNWSEALAALQHGKVDVLSRGSLYEARMPELLLSRPYVINQTVLVARERKLEAKLPQVSGKIAFVEGYISAPDLLSRFPQSQPSMYLSVKDGLHSVEYRRNDWFIGDAVTVSYQLAMGELPSLHMRPLESSASQGYSFVFRQSDASLRDSFDAVLAVIPELTQANILSYWGVRARFVSINRPDSTYTSEEIKWLDTNPVVRVAVGASSPPFTFYDEEGNFRGLLADLLAELGQRSGLQFSIIEQSSLSSLLEALKEGDADMALMLLPSPKREEYLRFTQPYISNSFVLVGPRNSQLHDLDQLNVQRVAVLRDSVTVDFLEKKFPHIERVEVGEHLDSLISVAEGRADAALLLLPVARYLIDQYFADDLRIQTSLPELQAPLPLAVRKDLPLLHSVLEKTLDQIEPAALNSLTERWQGILPAEDSVWGSYVRVMRWVGLAAVFAGCVLCAWFVYDYVRRNRLKAEASLQAFRSTLLDGIPQSIVVRDLQGRIILCNQHFYRSFNVPPEQVIGISTADLPQMTKEQANAREKDYFDLLKRGKSDLRQIEIVIGGRQLTLKQWAVPYNGSDGSIAGLIMGWIDMTASVLLHKQLQDARDEAVRASNAKSQFLAVMSHEIRTPLNAIIGLLELAMRRVDQGEGWDREAIEVAYSSSNALLLLIGDILDLAKIESGKLSLNPQPCDPLKVLDTVVRVFQGLARQKGLYLQVDAQSELSHLALLDAGRLKQVLSNLVSNAIKFTDRGGVNVVMRAEELGANAGRLLFEVNDSGIGISDSDQIRLFEPFVQIDRAGHQQGTGLGLVISRQLIEMMDGELTLASCLGEGTRITVTVPVTISEEWGESAEGQPQPSARPSASTSLRALVVDDHPANRMLLGQQLSFLGHSVEYAKDGQQALELIEQSGFDLVMTDCNMPVMNGYELVRHVRSLERARARQPCRIIGFTANAQAEERERCLAVGMDDCLFKPVGLDILAASLDAQGDSVNARDLRTEEELPQEFDVSLIKSLTNGDDQLIRMLLKELLDSNRLDMQQLESALSVGQVKQGPLVHRLKGAARMVGAQMLVDAALAYEVKLASGAADDDLELLIGDVRKTLSALQTAVEHWLACH